MPTLRARTVFLCTSLGLAACHGGGGGGSATSYTVGGTVSGLAGSGLVLQNNGANDLSVAASGAFTFSTALAGGAAYGVTILTQPTSPSQTCAVTGGSGTVGNANVATAQIACTTNRFAVGGNVTGLQAIGMVLQNNAGDDLPIAADGAFTFPINVTSGAAYAVTVRAQPDVGPAQLCSVTNGTGNVGSGAVTNVAVACALRVYKYLYVPNRASATVSGYSINATTGALAAVPGSPFPARTTPGLPAAEPSAKFLYVANVGSASESPTVSGYSVDAGTGTLSEVAGSPFALSVPPPGPNQATISPPLVHSSGAFAYVSLPVPFPVSSLPGQLFGETINSLTGELTPISGAPYDNGWSPVAMVFDATGTILFAATNSMAGGLGAQIKAFRVNAPSGVLTPIQSFSTGGSGAVQPLLTSGDKFLLVTSFGSSNFTVFAVDKSGGAPTGTLTTVTSPPILTGPSGSRPTQIVYNPRNNVAYVLNLPGVVGGAPASIAVYRLDGTTGVPTAVSAPVLTNGGAGAIFLHPSGRFLFQFNSATLTFQRFALDPTTGAATLQADVTAVGGANGGFVIDSSGKYLYATNSAAGTVLSYSIDPTTGALTQVSSTPAGGSPGFPTALLFQ